jgi:hypothetical protein
MRTMAMKGAAVMKYHFIDGLFWKVSTFMPRNEQRNVSGRKMNVIQETVRGVGVS